MKQQFLLVNVKEGSDYEFYSIDHTCGGYGYWSGSLANAKFFSSSDEIVKMIENNSDFVTPCRMADGQIDPPRLIHSAAGLDNKKQYGYANLQIVEIKFDLIKGFNIEAKIMIPKKVVYQY